MDTVVPDISKIAVDCETAGRQFNEDTIATEISKLYDAIQSIEASWSGSWIGYHSLLYLKGFRPKGPGEHFDSEWGLMFGTDVPWREYTYETVEEEILKRAGVSNTSSIAKAAQSAKEAFERGKWEILPILDALLVTQSDQTIEGLRKELSDLEDSISAQKWLKARQPVNFYTRDSEAMAQYMQGHKAPPHLALQAWLMEQQSYGAQAKQVARIARHVERYLSQKHLMGFRMVTENSTNSKVFIGHGRSKDWLELQQFIENRLHLEPDEFNREPVAGFSTSERLEVMLDNAKFALLVLTAEDEHSDSTKHARENVIHEVGLFQGKLGFKKAIVLLEEGCAQFSNIHGLTHIPFPRGNIGATFEKVRQVLEREAILK